MRKTQLFFLALVSGVLLSFAWIFPWGSLFLFFTFVPLILAEEVWVHKNRTCLSFRWLYLTFFTFNLLSIWWIAYVSLWGMLFIVAANALLMALVWFAAGNIKRVAGTTAGYFSLTVFWISFEYVSHIGVLPWPWLTLGNGLSNSIQIIQWYEFTGVLGGSLWILLVNILIAEVVRKAKQKNSKKQIASSVLLITAVVLPILISAYRYLNYKENERELTVVALQPNIDPYTEKFNSKNVKNNTRKLLNLLQQSTSDSTCLVVAPETSLPTLWEDSLLTTNSELSDFHSFAKSYPDLNVIVGAITQRTIKPKYINNRESQFNNYYKSYNSALLVNALPEVQISHKTILVAGVEKAPFREYFDFFQGFLVDPGGAVGELSKGEGPEVMKMKSGELIGPVICFESAFGNFVRGIVKEGAEFLVVLTNDGWWKHSTGVWQHFVYSKVRAVETRRSIVRSANTGISGIINQRGELISGSTIAETCFVKGKIKVNNQLTFYVVYGDYLGKCSVFLSLAAVLYLLYIRKRPF